MKTIHIYPLLALLVCTILSCTKNDEMIYYYPENSTAAVLAAINPDYILTAEEENEIFATFSWSATDVGYSAAIEYIMETDIAGKSFENPVELFAVKKSLPNAVTVGTMNKALAELRLTYDFAEGEAQSVEFRLKSSISDAAAPLYSNVISSSITPYSGTPTTMYMIGLEFGDWDWNGDVVEMIPANDKEGEFWCIRYFEAGKGFKWSPEKGWDKSFNALRTYSGFTLSGSDAVVEQDGLYIVYIDYKNSSMIMEPAQIYGIGDAFGGWDTGKNPFTVSGKLATVEIPGNGALRMYTTCSLITDGDWWRREFILLDGQIVYRGNGGDPQQVSVSAGQILTLDFNTGTGTIQ